jgi:hypothetical protein
VRKLLVAITAQFPVAVRPSFGRRLLRAFMRVGIGIAILYLLFYLFGPPLIIFFTARWESKKSPALNVAPKPLVDYSVSDGPGRQVSYFGYEFTAPWNSNFKEMKPKGIGIVGVKFDSGQTIIFKVFPDPGGLLTEAAKDPTAHMEFLKDAFPDLMKRSAYDQYDTLYNTTPASIHAFGSRVEATRGMILLTMKALAVFPEFATGAYSIDVNGKRGFQTGNPQKTNRLYIQMFDMDGQGIEFFLATKGTDRLTQPEVNRIISSLHAVPSQPAVTSATHNTVSHK